MVCHYVVKQGTRFCARNGTLPVEGTELILCTYHKKFIMERAVSLENLVAAYNRCLNGTQTPTGTLASIARDIQGVHSKKVESLTASAANSLYGRHNDFMESEFRRVIKDRVKYDKIIAVYNRIINIPQVEINFLLVWMQMRSDDDKEILFHQLLDCFEYGRVICNDGINNRMFYALKCINNEPDKTNIRQEMMNKAALIRNSLGEDYSTKDLKKKIKIAFRKDYVDTKILTIQELNKELKEWIEHV